MYLCLLCYQSLLKEPVKNVLTKLLNTGNRAHKFEYKNIYLLVFEPNVEEPNGVDGVNILVLNT